MPVGSPTGQEAHPSIDSGAGCAHRRAKGIAANKRHLIRTSILVIGFLGAAAVGAGVGGTGVALQTHAYGVVRLDGEVAGVVSVVNQTGSAICLIKDSDGSEVCSDVLQRRGDPLLTVGQSVSATSVWISDATGATAALVITVPRTGP